MSEEIWKSIPRFPGYEVSDLGRVRSYRMRGKAYGRFRQQPNLMTPVVRKKDGYLKLLLSFGQKRVTALVHALVLEAFIGSRPEGMEACHNNGIRTDNRLSNLRWDTQESNRLDKLKHGTTQIGERNSRAILTSREVVAILSCKTSSRILAARYGVSRSTIKSARNGRNWGHL